MIEFKENKVLYKTTDNKVIGEVEFISVRKNIIDIIHTYVAPEYRNQSIASKLLTELTDYYTNQGIKIIYSCSYAKRWSEKNKENESVDKN